MLRSFFTIEMLGDLKQGLNGGWERHGHLEWSETQEQGMVQPQDRTRASRLWRLGSFYKHLRAMVFPSDASLACVLTAILASQLLNHRSSPLTARHHCLGLAFGLDSILVPSPIFAPFVL